MSAARQHAEESVNPSRLSQLRQAQDVGEQQRGPRATIRQMLNTLKVTTPLMRAVMAAPDAGGIGPEVAAQRVYTLVAQVNDLTMRLAADIDPSAAQAPVWLQKTIAGTLAELVAAHWQQHGEINDTALLAQARLVIGQQVTGIGAEPEQWESIEAPTALRLAMISAMGPVVSELDNNNLYAWRRGLDAAAHQALSAIEASVLSAQATLDEPAAAEVDRRILLQGLINHVSSLYVQTLGQASDALRGQVAQLAPEARSKLAQARPDGFDMAPMHRRFDARVTLLVSLCEEATPRLSKSLERPRP